jgi:hypothetical protein
MQNFYDFQKSDSVFRIPWEDRDKLLAKNVKHKQQTALRHLKILMIPGSYCNHQWHSPFCRDPFLHLLKLWWLEAMNRREENVTIRPEREKAFFSSFHSLSLSFLEIVVFWTYKFLDFIFHLSWKHLENNLSTTTSV